MNILRQRIGKSYLCMIPIKKSQNNFNLVKTLSINSSTTVTSPATAAFESNSGYNTHFMRTNTKHPLKILKRTDQDYDISMGDHTGRLQNKIWTEDEIQEIKSTLYRHKPQTFSDHVMNKVMYTLYTSFNYFTGYSHENPTISSIEWRLIVLESVAGLPGFLAAGYRHFYSLRTLQRDHGWICSLLEEAENERMHLLVCLQMFNASSSTRFLVLAAQCALMPTLILLYGIHPKSCHRFVGYLEETACHTYANIIDRMDEPDKHLHAWSKLPAGDLAKGYWNLPNDAMWKDVLKQILADEAHHRDVNHTFAYMKSDDPNPFLQEHKDNAARAWRLKDKGQSAYTD